MTTDSAVQQGSAGKHPQEHTKCIARAMRQMMQFLDTHSRQLLKNQQVTVPQVMCLDVLREQGPLAVAALAGAIHLSPSTTVGIIDRLEKKKLVKRNRGSVDRRSVFVEITDAGRNFFVDAPHMLHNRLHKALQGLSVSEQAMLVNSLERLVQLLKEDGA